MSKLATEDTVEKVLKPCPFCGGEAEILQDGYYEPARLDAYPERTRSWPHCRNCQTFWKKNTKAEAIAAWNTRAAINAMSDVREALAYFVSRERSIKIDIGSAHKARGAGASDFMREDDADFRRELEAAFIKARAALESLSGGGAK